MSALDRCLANQCLRATLRILRWVPVAFVVAMTAWAYYAFVYQLCVVLVRSLALKIIYLTLLHILLTLFLWAYFQAVFTPTGRPPSKYYFPPQVMDELRVTDSDADYRVIMGRFVRDEKLKILNRTYDQAYRFCIKCNCIKPDRAHHCSVCGHCVLKFDHHCPWVNNCINYNNYKHFILFLGYGFCLCVFGFFAILPFFIDFWQGAAYMRSDGFGKFQVLFLFFVAGMFGLSMGCLFFYHLYLTARNQSTVESFRAPMFSYGQDKHGFDLGVRRNYEQVFGPSHILWFLPVSSSSGMGDEFPQKFIGRGTFGMTAMEVAPCTDHRGYTNQTPMVV